MDHPYCECCGESPSTIRTDHVGMCAECFARDVRETALSAGFGEECAALLAAAPALLDALKNAPLDPNLSENHPDIAAIREAIDTAEGR